MMIAIGRADLASDPALAHNDGRVAHTEEIEKVIADWVAARDLGEVLAVLERADVPAQRSSTSRTSPATPTTRRAG
jgi:formyl-CoA transferase